MGDRYQVDIKPLGRDEEPEEGWQKFFDECGERFYQIRFEGSKYPNLIINSFAAKKFREQPTRHHRLILSHEIL